MAADALRLLEFPELLELLGRWVGSRLGRARLQSLSPSQDIAAIRKRQALAAEAREYLRLQHSGGGAGGVAGGSAEGTSAPPQPVSFSGFGEPSTLLSKLGVQGTTLELAEITALLGLAERVLEVTST